MSFVILIAFIGILGALASAGFFMLRKGGDKKSPNMARALAVRVGVSVALFLVILLCWKLGWIHPTGLPLKA
ncbi:MAG: DUF2909 domain-containing protein [Burkholderiales bacterium]|jgi:hypothetical protein|uniref:DUF2909 domain-containing protein n=1 Tax=Roseateles sp. TaxID=1971397 RepID=UPI000F9E128C|nr:DUF2909 domain-containing protein [Methylibium sp.]MBY0364606.1 DUF2909 domain-containing protein [Burkholderiaceae bacterium]RTL18209.1 MAG: DUF2909 domain-containing protein [Burkholderiales bacterium]